MSDLLLADDVGGIDTADAKFCHLIGNGPWASWFCYYAGKPRIFKELTGHLKRTLGANKDQAWSLLDVMSAAEDAYDSVISRRIEREVLRQQYRIGFDQLSAMESSGDATALVDQIGRKISEARERIVNEMLYQDPTHLLVCGFSQKGHPEIFATDGVGGCTPYTSFGFHSIGSGGAAANAWLLANKGFLYSSTIAEIAYRVCEAKFIAENSPFVGKPAYLNVWYDSGLVTPLLLFGPETPATTHVIRNAWESRLAQPAPQEVLLEIERVIAKSAEIQSKSAHLKG